MNTIGRLRTLLFAPAVRPDFIAKLFTPYCELLPWQIYS